MEIDKEEGKAETKEAGKEDDNILVTDDRVTQIDLRQEMRIKTLEKQIMAKTRNGAGINSPSTTQNQRQPGRRHTVRAGGRNTARAGRQQGRSGRGRGRDLDNSGRNKNQEEERPQQRQPNLESPERRPRRKKKRKKRRTSRRTQQRWSARERREKET